MILQALVDYYERAEDLAPIGWELRRIPYIVELDIDGRFVQLTSLRTGKRPSDVSPTLVPRAEIRSGTKAYERPNALWDHVGFVLGHPKTNSVADKRAAERQLRAFRGRIDALSAMRARSTGLTAVQRFYERGEFQRVFEDPLWAECSSIPGCNLTFRLINSADPIVLAAEVSSLFDSPGSEESNPAGVCLVTGEENPIQRLHYPIVGIGAKPAPLSAIDDPAFSSFRRSRGFNFPVGKSSAFRYSTALNHLLRPGSRQRLQMGDTTTVFWAQKSVDSDMESWLLDLFGESDDPNARTEQLRALLESIRTGRFDGAHGENRFYVLGLSSPNLGRLTVRFWEAARLGDFAHRLEGWFADLKIVHGPEDSEFPGLRQLLATLCPLSNDKKGRDMDRLPPRIVGDTLRAVLCGGELPSLLLAEALHRCRAEQAKKDERTGKPARHVSYLRASLIRAYLNRFRRVNRSNVKEISVSLDRGNTNQSYLLGRLFATYERMQEVATENKLNRTIRDSFFGAAMATPRSVFPRLARLNQHHLRELKRSRPKASVYFERVVREITDPLNAGVGFPVVLTLKDQGIFTIGYYHQRQDFFVGRVERNQGLSIPSAN